MDSWNKFLAQSSEELIKHYQNLEQGWEECLHVLVDRFQKDLLEKCEIICSRYGHGPDIAEMIAQQTFEAFAKSRSFQIEKGTSNNTDKSFKLYLYKIAQNKLTDYYRRIKKEALGKTYYGNEKIITQLPEYQLSSLDGESRIRYEVIKSLSESHRVVYLTYFVHEKKGVNLSKALQEQLRTHLGDVKQSTIRTYKKEAFDKISQALEIYKLSKSMSNGGN